jgi:hypothetical protein
VVALEAWFDGDTDEPTIIGTAAELDVVLDTVAGWEGPHIVQLLVADDPGHAIFDVALHGKAERGALYYSARNRETWFSRGTETAAETPIYYYMSSPTEYPTDAEIPLTEVRRAAHEYMSNGGSRPTGVEWQPR